jgi:hypothetical protein
VEIFFVYVGKQFNGLLGDFVTVTNILLLVLLSVSSSCFQSHKQSQADECFNDLCVKCAIMIKEEFESAGREAFWNVGSVFIPFHPNQDLIEITNDSGD